MKYMRGMNLGSWRHEFCRLPVTVLVGLSVTVILPPSPRTDRMTGAETLMVTGCMERTDCK